MTSRFSSHQNAGKAHPSNPSHPMTQLSMSADPTRPSDLGYLCYRPVIDALTRSTKSRIE
ncbi:hypothetical protein BPAE_0586g00010 [Botrytis paeoniae]|uniref:Uncharacterized protein n=1 Tax=Botrytis paeoniae TaxID=278948 RepID=A0A4Z1ESK3_9HELO|nr:hypothetical protein BPAE_0586g00010 [Botrytis paeoniae]